jgi:hypothetical protein
LIFRKIAAAVAVETHRPLYLRLIHRRNPLRNPRLKRLEQRPHRKMGPPRRKKERARRARISSNRRRRRRRRSADNKSKPSFSNNNLGMGLNNPLLKLQAMVCRVFQNPNFLLRSMLLANLHTHLHTHKAQLVVMTGHLIHLTTNLSTNHRMNPQNRQHALLIERRWAWPRSGLRSLMCR